jgi:hypothetical protein
MIVTLLCAAVLGGMIGGAELVARYRDKPAGAVLAPSGLLYVAVNATAAVIALVATQTAGWRFGLPVDAQPVSVSVVQVMAAVLGAAALLRTSFTLAHDRTVSIGPIAVLHGLLKIVDAALERKRALGRLSHDDLAGLSFVRDHAALTELCCHALADFDLAEAQRLGELACDLRLREDLTDADKLDCFGLELNRLVGERALRKAAERLRARPGEEAEPAGEPAHDRVPELVAELLPAPEPVERPVPAGASVDTAALTRIEPAVRREVSEPALADSGEFSRPVSGGRLTRRAFRDG